MTPEELQAERQASQERRAKWQADAASSDGSHYAGIHWDMPRLNLGGGAYLVNVKQGSMWR